MKVKGGGLLRWFWDPLDPMTCTGPPGGSERVVRDPSSKCVAGALDRLPPHTYQLRSKTQTYLDLIHHLYFSRTGFLIPP